jgi:hypothetical protein
MSQTAPKKFNAGMPDILEEKIVDGRPVSQVNSEKTRPLVDISETKASTPPASNTQTPTGAVPSIITYSSSGRGPAKITVRLDPSDVQQGNIIIQPPEGWTGTSGISQPKEASTPMFTPRISRSSQGSESIRSSTTTIRTSMASISDGQASVTGSNDSSDSTAVSPDGPSPHLGGTRLDDVRPVPSNPLSASSSISTMRNSYHESAKGSVPFYDASLPQSSESRFSWHMTKKDRARNWFVQWFVEWWLLEIFSWVFSVIW